MENDKKSSNNILIIIFSVGLSVVASVGVFFYMSTWFMRDAQVSTNTHQVVTEKEQRNDMTIGELKSREDRVIDLVEKTSPAVVSVLITKNVPIVERYYEDRGTTGNPFFDQFFGGFQTPQYRENGTREQEVGGGTGFFVSEDGMLVTNRHVVSDEEAAYTVLTSDGEKYDAEILAVDPLIDIAILKVTPVEGQAFTHLTFADSEMLRPGQTSIAIGNALAEFQNSVSVGVISGLSRSIVAGDGYGRPESLDNVIQTDTAINPGNSGGPLLNLDGEVIGVNVAVARGSENIGFSLPSNTVKRIVESVNENGEIVRPYLGVRYIPVTESLQVRNSLPVDYGALIQRGETVEDLAVIPGSPADKAELRENDIILSIDGENVTPEKSLALLLREKNIDTTIIVKILRAGEEREISVILTAAPQKIE